MKTLLAICAAVAWYEPALAQQLPWFVRLYVENDSRSIGTDEYYTNGLRLSFGREGWGPWARWIAPEEECDGPTTTQADCYLPSTTFSGGQSMYTPRDLGPSGPIEGDRPYGGWLYGSVTAQIATHKTAHSLEASLGVVGPASLAGPTQRWWHADVVGAPRPNGWEHQISNRPALLLLYTAKHRVLEVGNVPPPNNRVGRTPRYLDVIPHAGLAVGNVFTFANAGGTARLGYNLPDDFGPTYIRPALPRTPGTYPAAEDKAYRLPQWGAYAFLTSDMRGVGYNVFIDAEANRHAIERRPLVTDYSWGIAAYFRGIEVTYQQVYRSREYAPGDVPHAYEAISLGYRKR